MLPESLFYERNPAAVMDKDYSECCEICLAPPMEREMWESFDGQPVHCLSCHETFANDAVFDLHRQTKTGGCRYPGNIDRFYETKYYPDGQVWNQKPDPNEKKEDRFDILSTN